MRAMNPACKAIGLVTVTFFLLFLGGVYVNLAVFFLACLLTAQSGIGLKKLASCYAPVLFMAAVLFQTGWHFGQGARLPVSAASLGFTDSRLLSALALSSRALAYASLALLFALTTDRVRLVRSCEQQLRLPSVFAYALLAAWGIAPQMMREYRRTRRAFETRGARVSPLSPRLLLPLLVKSVRWAGALSVAMESKGFDAGRARTHYKREQPGVFDHLAPLICLVCFLAIYLAVQALPLP